MHFDPMNHTDLYRVDPGFDGNERFLLCYVIHQNHTLCPPIVCLGDGLEAFLPSRVPQLERHQLAIYFQGLGVKINSYISHTASTVGTHMLNLSVPIVEE